MREGATQWNGDRNGLNDDSAMHRSNFVVDVPGLMILNRPSKITQDLCTLTGMQKEMVLGEMVAPN